ncbi:MAG TPA: dTMP kinase [Abditibacteriaceae bacterium]|jgi:dTMP kinase
MFLSFEGVDGAGKTTQIDLLRARLQHEGCDVVVTREPGGTRLAEAVRALLLDGRDALAPHAELLLFGAARAQHVEEIVRPALTRGAWVLCDRFTDSTLAYQGGGLGLDEQFIRTLNTFATGGMTPDATVLLDIEAREGQQRRAARNADRIEGRGVEFLTRVGESFRALAAAEPSRILCFDAAQPAEAIHDEIVKQLQQTNRWP